MLDADFVTRPSYFGPPMHMFLYRERARTVDLMMTFLFSYTMFFALYTDRITVMKKGGKGETIVHFIGIPLEYKSGNWYICSLITHILRQRKKTYLKHSSVSLLWCMAY